MHLCSLSIYVLGRASSIKFRIYIESSSAVGIMIKRRAEVMEEHQKEQEHRGDVRLEDEE